MTREDRFRELSGQVSAPLHRYVARRVAPADVDDVLSDISVVLWRRLDEVPADPLPWCYGVARLQVANHRRSAARRLRLAQRAAEWLRAEPSYRSEEAEHPEVHVALAALRPLDRELVQLWAWEQLEPREIAAVTGMTPNAVSIRLHRARQKLADELRKNTAPAGHEPDDRGSGR